MELAPEVLGLDVNKFPDVARYGDRSANVSSYDQMVHAATDAYVSDHLVGAELPGGN